MSTTPFMNLTLPTPTVTPGALYATENNDAFTIIDLHNHTAGLGVPIPVAGLSINGDLPINGNNLTLIRSARLQAQASPLSSGSDLACLYNSGGDLYYNDAAGNQIRITLGGAVDVSGSGNISGMGATTASVSYDSGTTAFSFFSNTNQFAEVKIGPLQISDTPASVHGITIVSPSSLASAYQLTLFTGLPASKKIVTVDNSGNFGATYDVDNTTLGITSNLIGVNAGGIGTTQLAALSVTAAKIANNTITATQITNATITGTQIVSSVALAGSPSVGSQLTVPSLINLGNSGFVVKDTPTTNRYRLTFSYNNTGSQCVANAQLDENTVLRTMRGYVFGATGAVLNGAGFTSNRTSNGDYTLTYGTAFPAGSFPSIAITCHSGSPTSNTAICIPTTDNTQVRIVTFVSGAQNDSDFFVTITGPLF